MGDGAKRARWKDDDGTIYEQDYQHGRVEVYDQRGRHEGEYDERTGERTAQSDSTRRVDP